MVKKKWTFLSNHGHVFAYVAEHPQSTTQYVAQKAGLSIRAVHSILDDLEEEGYLTRNRVGRSNHYGINSKKPLRHRLEKHHSIGDVLRALRIEVREKEIA
jgi:DNA-binding IclR family transcriptional regulator